MIKRVLIANRGEIALRVIRACKELGIESIAIYSEPDKESMHVIAADRALCIGPRDTRASYLNRDAILTAAKATGTDAIHPGYGFMAEDPSFARSCIDEGIIWIGPPVSAIERMGDKAVARETMRAAGVPIVPGSDGIISDPKKAIKLANSIGYPLLIKASAGGGGKGMRAVLTSDQFDEALSLARAEAGTAFGNDSVYLEKLLTNVRHIEVQVLGDSHGNVIHLGERDCSSQRRRQKVLEEAPAPGIPNEIRMKMGNAAVAAAKAVDYAGAGTVEFIYDVDSNNYYFMEMNTRIQVEHPITEFITGVDLVQEQISVADGNPLRYRQDEISFTGHAIECRINAEDPETFLPNAGQISRYNTPGGPGVRVDSHCYDGYIMPPFWDSLLAKLIVWAPTREEAIARMKRALLEYKIEGVSTTIPFQLNLLDTALFRDGAMLTDSVEKMIEDGTLRRSSESK
jgi:acetyl-CoA carboxylase biotin carboxylase subunit